MSADWRLYHGDCLEVLPTLPAKSVNAVIADIPYCNVVDHAWDKQWDTITDYQEWIAAWAEELCRIVKDNGSIYIFADDRVGAYVQVTLDKFFLFLNNIVWYKNNNLPIKSVYGLRKWAPMTERILFYTPQLDPTGWQTVKLDVNNFQPLRDYFRRYQEAIGLSLPEINRRLGHRRAEHAFYWNSTQWDLPTRETYQLLGGMFYTNGFVRREYEDLRREYEDLRREYEDLRREYEDLRRTWNTDGQTLDVIIGPIINQRENTPHPTTKPVWIMERLVKVSTNPGDTILDFTCGSGTTGVAAARNGRHFIGIDNGRCQKEGPYYGWRWVDIAEMRVKNAAGAFVLTPEEAQGGQLSLFAVGETHD